MIIRPKLHRPHSRPRLMIEKLRLKHRERRRKMPGRRPGNLPNRLLLVCREGKNVTIITTFMRMHIVSDFRMCTTSRTYSYNDHIVIVSRSRTKLWLDTTTWAPPQCYVCGPKTCSAPACLGAITAIRYSFTLQLLRPPGLSPHLLILNK